MNGEGSYFLVKFCRLDDSGVKVLEDMLGERVVCRLKIDWGGFSSRVMLYEANREDSSITLILFGLSDRMRHCSEAKLREAVSESLGGLFELEVSTISAEELASERPDVEKNIFPSLAMRGMRYGRLDAALTLKSGERLMEEAAAVCGWGGFCAALKRIARRMDNDASGKANLNVAFVVESDNPAGDYVRVLYDFYFSRGVISSPFICRGDMDDAASSSDGGFMYVVKDCGIDDDDVVVMGRRGVESCLRRLRSRKCVYAALLTKEEYEALASNPLFECVFPTVVRIAEPSAEEKLAFIRKEAAGYNFELAGDVTKETLDGVDFNNMLAKLVKAVSSRLEEEECSYTLSAADFAVEEKAREERPPFEELDALIGLDGVKRTVREIAAFVERRGKDSGLCLHMVFRGRPGTGKTTVARILGKIFGAAGVIKNADKFIEADRAALVSKYLGGTAPRVRDVVTAALGGNDCDFDWKAISEAPEEEHLPHTPADRYERNMRQMIDRARQAGMEPVLVNLPPIHADRYFRFLSKGGLSQGNILRWLGETFQIYRYQERYSMLVSRIAQECGCRLLDIRSAFLNLWNAAPFLCNDGIHPTAAGQELMGRAILAEIG